MDDIMSMVGQIMSDPEQMKQISSLAASLGISPPEQSAENNPPASDIPNLNTSEQSTSNDPLSSILPLMQKLQGGNDDKYITFLRAMQPILSEERRPKVDTAILLLKLLTFLPYLEESGVIPKNNILDTIQKFLKGVFP